MGAWHLLIPFSVSDQFSEIVCDQFLAGCVPYLNSYTSTVSNLDISEHRSFRRVKFLAVGTAWLCPPYAKTHTSPHLGFRQAYGNGAGPARAVSIGGGIGSK